MGIQYIFNEVDVTIDLDNKVSDKLIKIRNSKFKLFNENNAEVIRQKDKEKEENA